jgi:transposase
MVEFTDYAAYAGVDWATEKNDVCVVDGAGRVLAEQAFRADAEGIAAMADFIIQKGGGEPARVAVSIEVPHGPVVETLLERGVAVHSINPKQLDRFRDRFTMAGAKDDRRDARVLADSLRTDRRAFRALSTDRPDVIELREWSRMAHQLQQERNALCNRTREQLRRYFPQALELTGDLSEPWILDLLAIAPTPEAARRLRRSRVERILRDRRIRRWSADDVLRVLRSPSVHVAPGTVEAASEHVRLLRERILLVERQRAECNRHLETLCDRLGREDEGSEGGRENELRDVEILLSLPGVGQVIVTTLFAEASRPLRDRDYQSLRTLAGVAPVTKRSGRSCVVVRRTACNRRLQDAAYHMGRIASQRDERWRAKYAALRARGKTHGRACRAVADSLFRVAIAMLESRTKYDPLQRGKAAAA